MSVLDDDTLRAMLADRADRLSPNTAGEVMVHVRAEVRGPRQGAVFSVLPVLTGRSPAIGAGWAAAAMIAVLVMVMVATRPSVAAPSLAVTTPSVAIGSAAATPLPSGIPKRTAVELAGAHVQGPSINPLSELVGATAGAYRDLATSGALDGGVPVDPTRLVWAVTFTGFERQTIYVDFFTGAYLGMQHDLSPSDPAQSFPVATPQISPNDLLRVVNDGSYDGRLVLVNSTLRGIPSPVCNPAPCPPGFALDFVGRVVTTPNSSQPVVPAAPEAGSVPLTGTFVVVPWKGTLILVGRMEGSLASPVAWTTITSGYVPPDPGAEIAVQAVSGWLTRNVALPCASVASGGSGCGLVDQLTDGPLGSGGLATTPRVDAPALGVDATATGVAGPFLVRTGTGAGLEIVGRYDVGAYTTVDTPTVTCDIPADSKLPSCDKLVVYALQPLPDGAEMTAIEVHQGDWPCPSDSVCASAPPEQRAWVLVRSTSGDWEVGLTFDAGGYGVDIVQIPLPSGNPAPSPMPATCTELGYGQSSTLTCGAAIAAALKVVPAGTAIVSLEFGYGPGCPTGIDCPDLPPYPNTGHVIVRVAAPGRDLLVSLIADAGGVATAVAPVPIASASPLSVP